MKNSEWISVKDKLPEADVPVLVYQTYYEGEPVTIGRFNSKGYWQWIHYDYSFQYGIDHFGIICPDFDFVEAWMPLPETYKTQESENKE